MNQVNQKNEEEEPRATLDRLNAYYGRLKNKANSQIAVDILEDFLHTPNKNDKPSTEPASLQEDVEFLFAIAFSEVRDAMDKVIGIKKIDFDQLDRLLKWQFPREYDRLWGDLYQNINTDISGKQQAGLLAKEEYEIWKQNLALWKKAWLDILQKFFQSPKEN